MTAIDARTGRAIKAPAYGPDEHEHVHQGQRLVHTHTGGEVGHDYYEHPEDPPSAARDSLRQLVRPGDTLYTVLRHVSRSGRHARLSVYQIARGKPHSLTSDVAVLLNLRERAGTLSCPCSLVPGAEPGRALVRALAATLHGDADAFRQVAL